MTDLIPRKSWTLAFEEMEDVVFHLKELTEEEYLEAVDILEDFYREDATRKETEQVKLKLYNFMIIKVEGEASIKLKLNVAVQILKYLNPDLLEIKKQ